MKFFSSLVLLVQLAMLSSIAQAAFPSDDLLSFTTRELIQELQARLDIATPHLSSQNARRSIAYDNFVEFSARGGSTAGASGGADTTVTGDTTAAAGGATTDVDSTTTTDATGSGGTTSAGTGPETVQGGGGTGGKGGSHRHGHHRGSGVVAYVKGKAQGALARLQGGHK